MMTEMLETLKDVQQIVKLSFMAGTVQEEQSQLQILVPEFVGMDGSFLLSNVMTITQFQTMDVRIVLLIMAIHVLPQEEETNHATRLVEIF